MTVREPICSSSVRIETGLNDFTVSANSRAETPRVEQIAQAAKAFSMIPLPGSGISTLTSSIVKLPTRGPRETFFAVKSAAPDNENVRKESFARRAESIRGGQSAFMIRVPLDDRPFAIDSFSTAIFSIEPKPAKWAG